MPNTNLHDAAKRGNKEEIIRMILEGNDVNLLDNFNSTPLHKAATEGHKDVVEVLLAHGSNINSQDNCGNIPLHKAASKGHKNVVEVLLTHGSDITLQNKFSYNTPLHEVAAKGHKDVVKILLTHGSEINLQNSFHHTPLSMALSLGYTYQEIIKLFIAYIVKLEHCGTNIDSPGFLQNKALMNSLQFFNEFTQECEQEIQKLKNIHISGSNLSVFDIFIAQKDINALARYSNNGDLADKIKNECYIYAPLIDYSFKAGANRDKLLQR
ncbi:ankyrin repeat domain-containing protein [Orientia tsutsugamushi]|uniref:ankyrin repeat domain-containing protein n=1 Tax=Orientia tsutsugamushi TaxID=784 RepID=UPI000D5A55ED|nr:ankyrin repeat-containing protein 09 [Orientia tsutsugamushi]